MKNSQIDSLQDRFVVENKWLNQNLLWKVALLTCITHDTTCIYLVKCSEILSWFEPWFVVGFAFFFFFLYCESNMPGPLKLCKYEIYECLNPEQVPAHLYCAKKLHK